MPVVANFDGRPAPPKGATAQDCGHWLGREVASPRRGPGRDFDPDARDLPNALATLSDDGFEFVERTVVEVFNTEFDPNVEFFDPRGAMASDTSSPTPTNEVQPLLPAALEAVNIPG